MLSFALSWLLLCGPIGIDFSALPAKEPERGGFELWIVVYAANGDTYDNGRWAKWGPTTRDIYMELTEDDLKKGGCTVERCGDVLVVQTLNGSPVKKVDVRVKNAIGAAPALTLGLRSQADKPKKEKK